MKITKRPKYGLAHLCHHDKHWEFCYDFDERVRFIKENKPAKEIPTRLKFFQIIPDNMLPGKDSPQGAAYEKASAACDRAWDAYRKAYDAYVKASAAYGKAWDAYVNKYEPELNKLHDKVFPDCPWDGETMFPKKKNKRSVKQ